MSKDDRDNKVRAVLEATSVPLGPTEIARRIGEAWCMLGGYPMSSAIVPVLRRIGAIGERGKYTMRPNVELTGAAAGLSPQRPATEGSEVERRVGPLDGKCGFCGAVAHAGEEWGYTKDLAQQWVLSCPRCCSESGGAVREIAANGLPGASKW